MKMKKLFIYKRDKVFNIIILDKKVHNIIILEINNLLFICYVNLIFFKINVINLNINLFII